MVFVASGKITLTNHLFKCTFCHCWIYLELHLQTRLSCQSQLRKFSHEYELSSSLGKLYFV